MIKSETGKFQVIDDNNKRLWDLELEKEGNSFKIRVKYVVGEKSNKFFTFLLIVICVAFFSMDMGNDSDTTFTKNYSAFIFLCVIIWRLIKVHEHYHEIWINTENLTLNNRKRIVKFDEIKKLQINYVHQRKSKYSPKIYGIMIVSDKPENEIALFNKMSSKKSDWVYLGTEISRLLNQLIGIKLEFEKGSRLKHPFNFKDKGFRKDYSKEDNEEDWVT